MYLKEPTGGMGGIRHISKRTSPGMGAAEDTHTDTRSPDGSQSDSSTDPLELLKGKGKETDFRGLQTDFPCLARQ